MVNRNRPPSPSPIKPTSSALSKVISTLASYVTRRKKKRSPKLSIATIAKMKKLVRSKLASKAAIRRTLVWNKVIKEAQNLSPEKSIVPPGFKGTTNQKYAYALTLHNRLVRYAKTHPMVYNQPLYRGISGPEFYKFFVGMTPVHKINLSSFSKDYDVARRFAEGHGQKGKRAVLVLEGGVKIPSVDYTTGRFRSMYPEEYEVVLPPGTFTKLAHGIDRKHGMDLMYIKYKAD